MAAVATRSSRKLATYRSKREAASISLTEIDGVVVDRAIPRTVIAAYKRAGLAVVRA
jgi:hypothetical protein